MAKEYSHVLYNRDSVVAVVCERKDWKRCPEHKHLSIERPDVEEFNVVVDDSDFADDPDDDITSVNEYHEVWNDKDYYMSDEGYKKIDVNDESMWKRLGEDLAESENVNETKWGVLGFTGAGAAGIGAAGAAGLGAFPLILPILAAGGLFMGGMFVFKKMRERRNVRVAVKDLKAYYEKTGKVGKYLEDPDSPQPYRHDS